MVENAILELVKRKISWYEQPYLKEITEELLESVNIEKIKDLSKLEIKKEYDDQNSSEEGCGCCYTSVYIYILYYEGIKLSSKTMEYCYNKDYLVEVNGIPIED